MRKTNPGAERPPTQTPETRAAFLGSGPGLGWGGGGGARGGGGSARQSASKLTYELPAYAPIQNLIEQTALIKVNWRTFYYKNK